jgi:hypothetical protein
MAQVYGAGGKTTPKRGRLGTGSYWPQGTPVASHRGNVFPGVQVVRPDFPELAFGDTSRASIGTIAGRNQTRSAAFHPNQAHYNLSTLPLAPATVVSSAVDSNNLQPLPPSTAPLQMPHERNTNSASGTRKKPLTFRTVFGASKAMPTDSAFQAQPAAMYRHTAKPKPGYAVEAVKKQDSNRTIARPYNPLPVSGGVRIPRRTPPASFVSHGNNWMDPNNSFIVGAHNSTSGALGAGRWHVVKKGVV